MTAHPGSLTAVELMESLGHIYGFVVRRPNVIKIESGPIAGLLNKRIIMGENMNNTLEDLNGHLFAVIERLGNEDLKGDELKAEIARAQAVQGIAGNIINNARLAVDAERIKAKGDFRQMPKMIRAANDGD